MVLQESGEMYLETIYVLSQKSDYVRSIDVGEELNFSRPSVSRAIHILEEGGFLTIGQGGALRLTDTGPGVRREDLRAAHHPDKMLCRARRGSRRCRK